MRAPIALETPGEHVGESPRGRARPRDVNLQDIGVLLLARFGQQSRDRANITRRIESRVSCDRPDTKFRAPRSNWGNKPPQHRLRNVPVADLEWLLRLKVIGQRNLRQQRVEPIGWRRRRGVWPQCKNRFKFPLPD